MELVPKSKIEALQREMVKLPQAEGLFTTHHFSGGMYLRKLYRPAGTLIVGKVHKAHHFFLCLSGEILAWSEHGMRHLKPGDVIESERGTKRVTFALTDSVGVTIHRTDKTDLEEIERELLEPDDSALFNAGNVLKFDVPAFRELTAEVIRAEKPGFWSDWTQEERELYVKADWRAFSESRGYSPEQIEKYALWLALIKDAQSNGLNPYVFIQDLASAAAIRNIALDKNGEIHRSSHLPFESREAA